MRCGICGGEVRGFAGTLHGRPIRDWKHRTVPAGVEPHRPVLGRPVSAAELNRAYRPESVKETQTPKVVVTSVVPARLATMADEVAGSALQLIALGVEYGWEEVDDGPLYMRGSNDVETCVVRLRRRDLGVAATWERRTASGFKFADGYQIVRNVVERVGSNSLKDLLRVRDEECPDCRGSVIEGECSCPEP